MGSLFSVELNDRQYMLKVRDDVEGGMGVGVGVRKGGSVVYTHGAVGVYGEEKGKHEYASRC